MADLKISQFADGGKIQETDEIATNRGGVNTKVFVGSAAEYDVGIGDNDIPTNSTIPTTIANTLSGTSATENTIGLSSLSFITEQGKSFEVGRWILIVDSGNPAVNAMTGIVTSYDSETGELDVDIENTLGSGTIDDWLIYVSGISGMDGERGWSPVLGVEADGDRRVFQIVDWVGGEGTKPSTGDYIGPTGLVSDISSAVDVRGPQGAAGVGGEVNVTTNDTTPGVLNDKLVNGTGLTKTVNNPAGNETLELEVNFSEVATAAQGAKADTAIQPNELVVTANTGASYNMNFANAQNFVLTMTADCTLNITNPPTNSGKVALKLIQDSTPRTPTFSMSGLSWAGGSAPTIPAGSGDYVWLVFVTTNGGTSWDGFLSGEFEA